MRWDLVQTAFLSKSKEKMNGEMISRPLDAFPATRSSSPEQVEDVLKRSFGALSFDLSRHDAEALDLRANHWQSQNIGLSYCSYRAPVQLGFPGAHFYRQQFSICGAAEVSVGQAIKQVTNEESAVVPPDTPIRVRFAPGFEQLVLRIEADRLIKKLGALLGIVPSQRLIFKEQERVNPRLARLVRFFASQLDEIGSNEPSLEIAELEQALMVSFLCNNPHNYSAFLDNRVRPLASSQVRRAEEYILAHWDRPITIETLAQVTSASARSLFREFKRSRGQSPMAFVKQVRLQRAREMLESNDLTRSVTEVALACGFGNLGHFAGDYFKCFGERPSDTFKRVRRQRGSKKIDLVA